MNLDILEEKDLEACVKFFAYEIREHNAEYKYVTDEDKFVYYLAIMRCAFAELSELRSR